LHEGGRFRVLPRSISRSSWTFRLTKRASERRRLAGSFPTRRYVSPRAMASASPGHASRTIFQSRRASARSLRSSASTARLRRVRSPGHAPTAGDWETCGRTGRAGQETLPEPGTRASGRQSLCGCQGGSRSGPTPQERPGCAMRPRQARWSARSEAVVLGRRRLRSSHPDTRLLVRRGSPDPAVGPTGVAIDE